MISILAKISMKLYQFNIIDFIKIFVELHYVIILMFYIKKPVFDQLLVKMAKLHLPPNLHQQSNSHNFSFFSQWNIYQKQIKAIQKKCLSLSLFLFEELFVGSWHQLRINFLAKSRLIHFDSSYKLHTTRINISIVVCVFHERLFFLIFFEWQWINWIQRDFHLFDNDCWNLSLCSLFERHVIITKKKKKRPGLTWFRNYIHTIGFKEMLCVCSDYPGSSCSFFLLMNISTTNDFVCNFPVNCNYTCEIFRLQSRKKNSIKCEWRILFNIRQRFDFTH